MTCPPISISPSAKYLWLVVVHLLVNQVHGVAFEAAAAAAGSPTVAHSDTNDRHKFGGFAEHALAHTWVSRKLQSNGGTAGVGDCFLDLTYEEKTQKSCESCCSACTKTTVWDNRGSKDCICSVLGMRYSSSTNKIYGSDLNDCIFITGNNREWIDASTPASDAAKERLPFPRAEMPPGAPKSERV